MLETFGLNRVFIIWCMAEFIYKARRRSGQLVQGEIEAADKATAIAAIERQGLLPVLVEPSKSAAPSRRQQTRSDQKQKAKGFYIPATLREIISRKRKPSLQELATYTQQLANLLNAGMPLTAALNSMSYLQTKNISKEISKQLRQDVTEGRSLSDAMAKQSHIFPDMYINMVRAGEQSGALVEVLERLALHYERFAAVRSSFTSALIYPAIVACVGVVIVFFFMTVMLPKFMKIFEGLNVPLPAATRMLIGISHFLSHYWWLVILIFLTGTIIFIRYQSSESGKRNIDALKLKLPVFGKVIRLNIFAQFARTLGTLLRNGVPVLTALKITENVIPNVIVKEAIAKTREAVTDGKTIAQPLARSGIFPQLLIDLVKIGEETGEVPSALERVADTYEKELTVALRVMTNLIEPVLIIFMALGVGFLLFSILSAMFTITSSIQR